MNSIIDLIESWKGKVESINDQAHNAYLSITDEERENPVTKGELAENLYGLAAGYAAAVMDLESFIASCNKCLGEGSKSYPNSTTIIRQICKQCLVTGRTNHINKNKP
jgi:hypothetical protein